MNVTVVGMGEIGTAVYKEIDKKRMKLGKKIRLDSIDRGDEIPVSDIYLICVYSQEQIEEAMNNIIKVCDLSDKTSKPLFIIESTCDPAKFNWFVDFYKQKDCDIAFFSHRYNPGDFRHYIFNLHRILGGLSEESEQRAYNFILNFMNRDYLHITTPETAIYCKPIENAYRFLEIAFAEGMKMWCDKKGLNFYDLREKINSKWNISIKEARSGIGGGCLPKDTKFVEDIPLLKEAIQLDENYKKQHELKKEVVDDEEHN